MLVVVVVIIVGEVCNVYGDGSGSGGGSSELSWSLQEILCPKIIREFLMREQL